MRKLVHFDWAIKHLLRNKANFDVLEGFLSELLKTPIHIEQILESESNKNHATDKYNRVDLLAKTNQDEYIIIEVQCSSQYDYLSRILYGTSKLICEHLHMGDTYENIRKVISVSIVFFDLGHGQDYLYHGTTDFKGMHFHDTLELNAKEKNVYGFDCETPGSVFPEYYIIKVTQFKQKVKDKFDEWVYFLKNGAIEKEFNAQGLQIAAEKLDLLNLSAEERRAYDRYKENSHDEASYALTVMTDIKFSRAEGRAEGMAEGLAQGMEKGLAEGLAEGLVKGRAEGAKEMQIKIVQSMKNAGYTEREIVALTGLSLEEITNREFHTEGWA